MRSRWQSESQVVRRLLVVALAIALVSALAPAAGATTKQELQRAKGTLHRLERSIDAARTRLQSVKAEIHAQRLALQALQHQLNVLAVHLSAAEGAYENTVARILTTQKSLEAAQAQYAELRARIDQRARALYEQGPGSNLELIFSATSLADLTD